MKKYLAVTIAFLVFLYLPGVQGVSQYKVFIEGTNARVNATVELFTHKEGAKANSWDTSLSLPRGAEILSVRDSIGQITDYSFKNGRLIFDTNKGPAKEREVVFLEFLLEDSVDTTFAPLKRFNLSLSGQNDFRADTNEELTQVQVYTDEDILSHDFSFGFSSQLKKRELTYEGEGPIGFVMTFSNGGERYENFVAFGGINISQADEAFSIIPYVVGFLLPYERIPLVVLEDKAYDKHAAAWSTGQFGNGLILIRKSKTDSSLITAVILHEATHAFNRDVLKFSSSPTTWFDEGVATYVEYIVNNELGIHQKEIFGEQVRWREDDVVYTLEPRGDFDDLVAYYEQDKTFMNTWTTAKEETREFGYAFSDLFVRTYALTNGASLKGVYDKLRGVKKEVSDDEEYNQILLAALDAQLAPCKSTSESAIQSCVNRANNAQFNIPVTFDVLVPANQITLENISVPENKNDPVERTKNFFEELLASLINFFTSLFS